jgi:protoporphyrinogen oxidase
MWEKTAVDFTGLGGQLRQGVEVTRIRHAGSKVVAVETVDAAGRKQVETATDFIISMPLRETVAAFDPPLPREAVAAAARLSYRDFLTVALVVDGPNPFPDNWIYIHDPAVKLGRIQNFGNWSPALIGEAGTTCLGLEYFCFEGDALWTMSDADLIALGKRELVHLGLADAARIRDGAVVRMEKAYPVYDAEYRQNVATIRAAIAQCASNLQVVGRNGMHKYNNQDHSMLTALLAVKNLQGSDYNLWHVNTDAEYHEEKEADDSTGRQVPTRVEPVGAGVK